MAYLHLVGHGPRQEQQPRPEQWGTIGLNPCSGPM